MARSAVFGERLSTMNILLSAYACEPHQGSEPGVGWHWAMELSKLAQNIWVITRKNNQAAIEKASYPSNVHFVYFDLPPWFSFWKKKTRGVHLYYFLWQIGAFLRAWKVSRRVHFDRVQHITFVSVRQPSFMGLLGIPFIFGPVAGGEKAPWCLRKGYPFRGKWLDFWRDLANYSIWLNPFMWLTFHTAKTIVTTSPETKALIPGYYHHKCQVQLAIGAELQNQKARSHVKPLKVLYVGNLLYLKGLHIALRAFASHHQHFSDSRLTIVGSGPEEAWLKELASTLGIASLVDWIPRVPQQALEAIYDQHQLLLFPSLHDSGGMVLLEAMSRALPVIAINLGGPGQIVTKDCGFLVSTERQSEEDVTSAIATALNRLAEDAECFEQLSKGALYRAKTLTWENQISTFFQQAY